MPVEDHASPLSVNEIFGVGSQASVPPWMRRLDLSREPKATLLCQTHGMLQRWYARVIQDSSSRIFSLIVHYGDLQPPSMESTRIIYWFPRAPELVSPSIETSEAFSRSIGLLGLLRINAASHRQAVSRQGEQDTTLSCWLKGAWSWKGMYPASCLRELAFVTVLVLEPACRRVESMQQQPCQAHTSCGPEP